MKQRSLNDRLALAQEKAELTIMDMANWIGVERPTMSTWLKGVVPSECRHSQILAKLDLLEAAIKEGSYFPMPMSVTQFKRKDYIQQVLNATISSRVSKARPSK